MRYQVMELELPRLSHGKTEDDRSLEVPGRIVAVLKDCGGNDRQRTLSVLVELDDPGETATRGGTREAGQS